MPVSPDKQILIRFRVPPSSQGSITRRHSNRDFPIKSAKKLCRGMYRDNWWNWYASWIYWSTTPSPPKQAVSREVTSFLLLSCQRCHHGWLVDYYPKWGVKWLLILPFSSLTTLQSVQTSLESKRTLRRKNVFCSKKLLFAPFFLNCKIENGFLKQLFSIDLINYYIR